MPLTVITLKKVPQSLRGDLTKWMQEIATGVYIGNFNTRIREKLWARVVESVGHGEATISFAYRNEIGYRFDTINAQREVVDYDGIPLILLPEKDESALNSFKRGYSDAAKFRRIKKYSKKSDKTKRQPYVVIDIETDGLDVEDNSIIEIAAIKIIGSDVQEFSSLIQYNKILPGNITQLTGITQDLLDEEGVNLDLVLQDFLVFVGDLDIVGYGVSFDIKFINYQLNKHGLSRLNNKSYDLLRYVKKEKLFLDNYRLQTVLRDYGINEIVPHRALSDARLICQLIDKVNIFR